MIEAASIGMNTRPHERLEQVLALVRAKVAKGEQAALERFVREYFRQVDPEDLAERLPEDLYGIALSHWSFGRRRTPGSAKLRVLNPTIEEHGWQSTHTVVEIVTDDMPFLVDSVTMAVNRCGLTLHLFMHPIIVTRRDSSGQLVELTARDQGSGESFMHIEVDRISDAAQMERLTTEIESALHDVRAAVADWKAMVGKVREILEEMNRRPPPITDDDLAETRAFLEWLAANHFTFLGYRSHDLVTVNGQDGLKVVPGSGLGILRDSHDEKMSASFAALPPALRERARQRELLIITKANARSTVHRPGYLDYVGIKRFDERGEVCGEHRFLGLYTSAAYMAMPSDIPIIRRKLAAVAQRAELLPQSHSGKELANILDTYPRDELFQIGTDELFETALGILHLGERQRLRLFVRRDPFERFVSCLIYAPRENYNSAIRGKWQRILTEAFNGASSEFNVFLSESMLARILITVRTAPGAHTDVDVRELELRLADAARRWDDDLQDALEAALGEARGNALFREYGAAFPVSYREDVTPRSAVADIEMMATLSDARPLGLVLYRPLEAAPGALRFKLFRSGAPVTLSDSLPMLEHMGLTVLDERSYPIQRETGPVVWLHDFGMKSGEDGDLEIDAIHRIFEDAFERIFRGEMENDDFNRLVLLARLSAEEVTCLRAYARYLHQVGFAISQSFVQQTLAAHPAIARMLVNLFKLRFDPANADDTAAERQAKAIAAALDKVANLNEDRVVRQLLALVGATLRTNYFRSDRRGLLSLKFDPAKVPGLPEPRPLFEIFVYSPRFEGVHLRGGKVARGGLRWSDRPEDFRTEVLGLMKAQMVKNVVIVPVGSKGGFILKRAPPAADRDALLKEGIACYQDYLRGLLDITDNRVAGQVVPPPEVRRLDPDDPYLVVAADKGTATFSDYANAISKEYGFWLDDAFASGGSAGYDHKKMAITARGAWEAVKRHFREMGVDTQTTDFTVAGIGDMSGDVFGNGVLLSKHIKLVAAFDHRHVFIDPDPDPARSFDERTRLFELPRSSWADYNPQLISKGGGVWSRSAKSIPISPEAKRVLGIEAGIEADPLTPNEVISAILTAPVDLLYNGGIGTYVKAATESHADVGDRTNDAVRVNAARLRCKVVGEGGNLGFTQRGRIEYAHTGGRINTDAIDNSAGVATSDHEVNIKILLGLAIAEGELTEKQRNKLLVDMTDDVAKLVLRDNYFQTQSLSVSGRVAPELLDPQARFMRFLEKAGRLNRAIEFLPTDEEIAALQAAKMGLTSPERAVLLAYSKMWLYDELVESKLPDDLWVATALERYFPPLLHERFAPYMPKHPLKREIIATHVVNSMLNRVGSTFVHSLMERTGAKPAEIVRAYLLQREIFGYVELWQAIEALDGKVADVVQSEMLIDAGRVAVRLTAWLLRSKRLGEDTAATIAYFSPGVQALAASLPSLLDVNVKSQLEARASHYIGQGVPTAIAQRLASFDILSGALDIIELAAAHRKPIETVARVYFDLAASLDLPWLRERIGQLVSTGHWETMAKNAMRDDLAGLQRTLTSEVLTQADAGTIPGELVARWQIANSVALERVRQILAELRSGPAPDLAMLSVALRELRNLG